MSTDDYSENDPHPHRGDDNKPARDANGRWLPGHCPNPRGRPRKKPKERLDQSDLAIFGNTYIDVITNGQKETMLRREALLSKMYESAMKGRVSMQRFLYDEFKKNDERMAAARVRYERLLIDWIIDNPDFTKPDFEIPFEVRLEMDGLRAVLNHYYPTSYPLDDPPRRKADHDDNSEED